MTKRLQAAREYTEKAEEMERKLQLTYAQMLEKQSNLNN